MPISETQLQTWTNAPGSTKPQYTYGQIQNAILQNRRFQTRKPQIYLQGSYSNSTNIKIDSDIDVVVEYEGTVNNDTSLLPVFEPQRSSLTTNDATYRWENLKQDVAGALSEYFGSNLITSGEKSLKLLGNDRLVKADIVPCIHHRRYFRDTNSHQLFYYPGMTFWTRSGQQIINFPKLHGENGEGKNHQSRTDQIYKHSIRIFKNIKRKLVENGMDPKIAPSYFLECIIYNVPDNYFSSNYSTTVQNILHYILRQCQPDQLLTASHQHSLFGTMPWQWNTNNAATFFQLAEQFYNS